MSADDPTLREVDEAHRLLFEASPVPLFVFDVDTLLPLAVNEAALLLYGYARAEFLALEVVVHTSVPWEARRAALAEWGDRESCGTSRYRRKDGTTFVGEFTTRALPFAGSHARIVAIKDVTARYEAEETRTLLAAIVTSSSDAIMSLHMDGTITSWNDGATRLFGYTAGEAIGQRIDMVVPEELRDEEKALLGRVASGERVQHHETLRRRRDATLFPISISLSPLRDGAGKVVGVSGIARDLTAEQETERRLALLAAIVQSSHDAIVSKGLDGIITSWNPAAERLFGYATDEAVGKPVTMLIPPERLDEERMLIGEIAAGRRVEHYETVRIRKDGSEVPVSISLSPILDARGRVVGASKTARDLTAQRRSAEALARTEEQLRQAQKMEAVGRLAGGVAHDFNNMLSVILSYSSLLLQDLKPNEPMREDVEEISKAGSRAAELTRQLLLFSRQQIVQPKVLDLNDLLAGMIKMLKRLVGEDVDFMAVPTHVPCRFRADPGSVEQVIMNLVVNARDAMPTGGKLTIEAALADLDEDYAREHIGCKPGPHVMVAVTDTGIGMDRETQARIFEPFFTTKAPGSGTGLGLSTVFGITQQSGGSVWVYSEVGKGTTFKVYFPRVEEAVDVAPAPLLSEKLGGTETILLVDDEALLRHVASVTLKRFGYRVIVAQNPGEALLLCESHPGAIDLLLTDVVMPQMSGPDLARRLAAVRPAMRVLCMSGYADDSVVRHGVIQSGVFFLQKPFTPDSLARKVRETLSAPVRTFR